MYNRHLLVSREQCKSFNIKNMANSNGVRFKVVPDCGVFVLELFGPNSSPPKLHDSIFNRQSPNEWKGKWLRDIDILFACIGFCGGLGNLWRFPFIALENGGGIFLVVYFTVLLLIGAPILYLEMIIGQFTSRGGARVFDCAPIMRGIGYGQVIISTVIAAYYSAITALAGHYLSSSMRYELPWSVCQSEWNASCVPSSDHQLVNYTAGERSSAELYFRQTLIKQKGSAILDESMDIPNVQLIIYLAVCWLAVGFIVTKGLRVLSELGCFLVFVILTVLIVLLAQAFIIPGGLDGVIHFIIPKWSKLLKLPIWYTAINQIFFSLGICLGPITMYSSFNKFSHNIYKDITILISFDIIITLLASIAFFAAVGNAAPSSGWDFIHIVNRYHSFVMYSDLIAKFEYLPQVSSGVFFLMLSISGLVFISGLSFFVVQMIREEFRIRQSWKITIPFVIIGFIFSNIYLTPIGEYILNILDFFGASFPVFFIAIAEIITFGWIYGLKRICDDIEFMFGLKHSLFWRLYGRIKIPIELVGIFVCYTVYYAIEMSNFNTNDITYSSVAYVLGWCLTAIIILVLVIWAIYVINQQPDASIVKKLMLASRPGSNWGPSESSLLLNYRYFILKKENATP